MQKRRSFIRKTSALAAGVLSFPALGHAQWAALEKALAPYAHLDALALAGEEDFWYPIQKAYTISPHFINLENGYFSLQADEVMEAQIRNIRMVNEAPAFYMRRRQWDDKALIKQQLATFAGTTPDEIALHRNTTEALNTVILGLDFRPGDEIIMSSQDYGSMLEAFAMKAKRYGTVNKIIDLPLNPNSDQEIVDAYAKAITPRTRLIHVTHLINLTGQILPVKKIADMAHARGIEVVSDSAHAFAQLDFKIPDLGCDYLGASLHKWLGTPVGLGLLYVKKDKISKVWPLMGDTTFPDHDIRKLEHIGTHPCSSDLTIAQAIRFHEAIGTKRKEARLRYLTRYWMERVGQLPKVRLYTPSDPQRYCGLGNVGIEGMPPATLAQILFDQYRIFTVAIDSGPIQGVRITPHLYTRLSDLDALVKAMGHIAG
jgi:selenocysteine lyase/cysteine desulfurase